MSERHRVVACKVSKRVDALPNATTMLIKVYFIVPLTITINSNMAAPHECGQIIIIIAFLLFLFNFITGRATFPFVHVTLLLFICVSFNYTYSFFLLHFVIYTCALELKQLRSIRNRWLLIV